MAGSPPRKRRSVRRSPLFEELYRQLSPNLPRLDEQLRAAEWKIAVAPEACPLMEGTRLRLVKTDPFPNAPQLRVFFTVDDDDEACEMQYLEVVEGPASDDAG